MKLHRSFPFVIALALLLLHSQQAAYWHLLGHLGTTSTDTVVQQQDVEHGAPEQLSHVCSTCLAFAGVDAVPLAAFAGPAPAAFMLVIALGVSTGFLHAFPQWRALPRGPPSVF